MTDERTLPRGMDETKRGFLRRHVFLWTSAAAFASYVPLRMLFAPASPRSQAQVVERLLRHTLHYLTLEPEGVRRFAHDFVEREAWAWKRDLYVLTFVRWSDDALLLAARRRNLKRFEEHLVTRYLMSSDFFWNRADTSRVVRYDGYYPTNGVCPNPFAAS